MARSAAAPGRWRSLLLGFAVAGMMLLDWRVYTAPVDISPIAPPPAAEPSSASTADLAGAEVTSQTATVDLTEAIARPLFRPDRRPYVPKAPEVAVAEEQPAQDIPPPPAEVAPTPPAPPTPLPAGLRLVGIVTEGGRPRALLRRDAMPVAQSYEAGAELDGWRIARVDATSATLSVADQTTTLELFARQAVEENGAARPQAGVASAAEPQPQAGP